MDPLTIGLITGGANLLGSWFSSEQSGENTAANIAAQQQSQAQSQAFNAAQAQLNRDFQGASAGQAMDFSRNEQATNRQFQAEQVMANRQWQTQMSNSAYQRSMADMKAAGLNPILAAGAGGASTPSGGAASGGAASGTSAGGSAASSSPVNMAHHNTTSAMAGIGDAVSKSVSSAIQAKTFEKMTDEISNIQADTAKTKAMESLVQQQKHTETYETTRRANESDKSHYQVSGARLSAEEARAVLSMPAWLRDTLVQTGYGGKKVDEALSSLPGLASSAKSVRSLLPSRERVERTTTNTSGHGSSSFEERFRGGY